MRAPAIKVLLVTLVWASAAVAAPQRATSDNTRGWQFMSEQERIAHQARLRSFDRYADCHAYQLQHHALMQQRAQAQGKRLPVEGRDGCAPLRPPDVPIPSHP